MKDHQPGRIGGPLLLRHRWQRLVRYTLAVVVEVAAVKLVVEAAICLRELFYLMTKANN